MRPAFLKRLLASFLLALLLFLSSSCAPLPFGSPEYFTELSNPGAIAKEGSVLPRNEDCLYVSDYLEYWGMPAFRKTKLITVEKFYEDYFIGTLPALHALSEEVYDLYRENFTNRPDFDERVPENVTGALIACYQAASDDRYAVYMTAEDFSEYEESFEGDYIGVGIYVQHDAFRDESVILNVFEGSPAAEADLRAGDIILSVNSLPLAGDTYEEAFASLKGKAGERITLEILRDGAKMTFTLTRRKTESYSVSWRILSTDASIGYIKIEEFNAKTAKQFKHAYNEAVKAGADKLIFDVRDNPGGEINAIADVLDYLLADGGPITHFRYKEGTKLAEENTTFFADDGHASTLPMAVLCNEGTASAGELFTAALRDYNVATIVGEATYGKGTMQHIIALPDGSAFTISVARYDPPYGGNYEGVGVIPHVEIALPESVASVNAFLRNEADDTQLQAAIHALNAPLV